MSMKIRCIWEHNGDSSILYAVDHAGAFTRGASKEAALQKMPSEIRTGFSGTVSGNAR